MCELKNIKHEKYCRNFLKSGNQTQSYLDSGYKCNEDQARKYASRLMTNEDIKRRIEELRVEISKRSDFETDEVLAEYIKSIRICGHIVKRKIGNKIVDTLVDAKQHKGTLDSLARIKGMFIDKSELKISRVNQPQFDVSKLSTDEIVQLSNMMKRISKTE